jgi:hypothetical protein
MLLDIGEQRIDGGQIAVDVSYNDGIASRPPDRSIRAGGELLHCRKLVSHAANLTHADQVNGPLLEFLRKYA